MKRTRWRVFVDQGPSFILTNGAVASGGQQYNFLSRGGGGGSFRLTQTYWLEATFRWAHISDGRRAGSDNPSWGGEGVSLGLRHAFR
ncbi:MAG: hypothetical protein WBV31_10990 [Terriglobales bacterium]